MIAAAGAVAARQLEEIAGDVASWSTPARERLDDVAGLGRARSARVDEDPRAADRVVVRLAHLGREAADQIEMDAERQPMAGDQRRRATASRSR